MLNCSYTLLMTMKFDQVSAKALWRVFKKIYISNNWLLSCNTLTNLQNTPWNLFSSPPGANVCNLICIFVSYSNEHRRMDIWYQWKCAQLFKCFSSWFLITSPPEKVITHQDLRSNNQALQKPIRLRIKTNSNCNSAKKNTK